MVEKDVVHLFVLHALSALDLLDFFLHKYLAVPYFLRHFLEESLFAVDRYIEDGLFKLGEPIIVLIEVLFEDNHALTVQL